MNEFVKQLNRVVGKKKERDALIRKATKKQLNSVRNICYRICRKKTKLPEEVYKKIYPYRQTIRDLANKKKLKSLRGLKKRLIQQGGFLPALLPALVGPLLSFIAGRALGV